MGEKHSFKDKIFINKHFYKKDNINDFLKYEKIIYIASVSEY